MSFSSSAARAIPASLPSMRTYRSSPVIPRLFASLAVMLCRLTTSSFHTTSACEAFPAARERRGTRRPHCDLDIKSSFVSGGSHERQEQEERADHQDRESGELVDGPGDHDAGDGERETEDCEAHPGAFHGRRNRCGR